MTQTLSDEELLQRVATQDRIALEALYDRYERTLYGFARKCVSDPFVAEEVVQDVFMKLWKSAAAYDPAQGRMSTWLLTITRRTAIDHFRKRQRSAQEPAPIEDMQQAVDAAPRPDEAAEIAGLRSVIESALNDLPSDQKLLIERIYFQGLTQRELAELLDVPIGTVKSRIRLGLQKLRDRLSATGWEVTP